MKRRIASVLLILALSLGFLISCDDENEFTHCELTLVLDDSFAEEESEDFDLLVSNGEVAVSLIRISFDAALKEGIPDTYLPDVFARFFMIKSERGDEVKLYGDVPYYTYTEKVNGRDLFYTVTFYRSYNAYFVVAYATPLEYKDKYSQKFLEYAALAYFNDAPLITN